MFFINEFKLSGICNKISMMKNDSTGAVQGFYASIATIGESYGVYIPAVIPGSAEIKEGQCYELSGHLKTKYSVNKNDKVSSVAGLAVVSVVKIPNPLTK